MNIKNYGDGFVLEKNNIAIFEHSKNNPSIFIGTGKAKYHMDHGHFDIKEDIEFKIPLKEYEIIENEEGYNIVFKSIANNDLSICVKENDGIITLDFDNKDSNINRMYIKLKSSKDEHIYGCGEQYSYFDLKGNNFPLWVQEQGVGRNKKTETTFYADKLMNGGGDYYTTYYPQPTFVTSKKMFCHVDSSAYMDFNFKNDEYTELEIWEVPRSIYIGVYDEYTSLLENLTGLLGRQAELPEWVYEGVWLGLQGGTETMMEKYNDAVEKGINISGIWIQDWEGKRVTAFGKQLMWNWRWDNNWYPGLDKEIVNLKEKGVRVLGYINPFLAIEGDLYKEASAKGYCVKNKDGEDYLVVITTFPAAMIDLTNPDAFTWIKEVIKENMIGFGLAGWMADFAEYLPTDAVLYSGENAEIVHNTWPVLWAKANREAIEEAGKLGEVVFFTRAGYTGTAKYSTMMWAGDQNVDWSIDDGLPSVIYSALSLGMSGYGLQHSDIGGYTTFKDVIQRSKELFMRWAEMGAFSSIMRTHEGNQPDENWQFDSDVETMKHYAKMSTIYKTLKPYIKDIVKENTDKGMPTIRPLFLHYEDEKSYEPRYQYLLGRDLLVAPVYEEGKEDIDVYLPDDNWVHIFTKKEYKGGEFNIKAPIGQPAAFYRKDSQYVDVFNKISEIK